MLLLIEQLTFIRLEMRKNKENFLPKLVHQLCIKGALIAGSRAEKLAFPLFNEDLETRDYDLLVPYNKWSDIVLLIPKDATVNSFGGWKFKTLDIDGVNLVEVDLWVDDPMNYLTSLPKGTCLYDYIKNRIYYSCFKTEL